MMDDATLAATARGWMEHDPDPAHRATVAGWLAAGDMDALRRTFDGRLAFGTAGLRARRQPGPLGINTLLVHQTAAGVAAWILADTAAAPPTVVVGHDARLQSDVLALALRETLLAWGLDVHWLGCTATPVVAWTVAGTGARAGFMVTASHNPPEDNGIKVFDQGGAQIREPVDEVIAACILAEVARGSHAPPTPPARAGVLHEDTGWPARWQAVLLERPLRAEPAARAALPFVYSAMHGVGAGVALPLFTAAGFTRCSPVEAQCTPDGTFPTVRSPNPEDPAGLAMAMAQAESEAAPLVLAHDPDADRLAVVARDAGGVLRPLHGDQVGCLLAHDLLQQAMEGGEGPFGVASSLVSSRMLRSVADTLGARCDTTWTGFKWIAEEARRQRDAGCTFVFGYEEAIGYTVGSLVPDKDGFGSALAALDLACRLHDHGLTLWDALEALWSDVGAVWLTGQRSLPVAPGLLDRLADQPPPMVGGVRVTDRCDCRRLTDEDRARHHLAAHLPPTPLLLWSLEDGSRLIIRPSGTEPKVKIYGEVCLPLGEDEDVEALHEAARARLEGLLDAARALASGT